MREIDIKAGKKVWYYPILGGNIKEEAIITSEPLHMCGTVCCFINIRTCVVDIENLKSR